MYEGESMDIMVITRTFDYMLVFKRLQCISFSLQRNGII